MHILLVLGLFGLATSTIYAGLVVWAALRFAARRRSTQTGEFTPPVSLLKPLHGSEPDLERRLESFFEQDYPGFEIHFLRAQRSGPGPLDRDEGRGTVSVYSGQIFDLR